MVRQIREAMVGGAILRALARDHSTSVGTVRRVLLVANAEDG